jgi:hypothetical protein
LHNIKDSNDTRLEALIMLANKSLPISSELFAFILNTKNQIQLENFIKLYTSGSDTYKRAINLVLHLGIATDWRELFTKIVDKTFAEILLSFDSDLTAKNLALLMNTYNDSIQRVFIVLYIVLYKTHDLSLTLLEMQKLYNRLIVDQSFCELILKYTTNLSQEALEVFLNLDVENLQRVNTAFKTDLTKHNCFMALMQASKKIHFTREILEKILSDPIFAKTISVLNAFVLSQAKIDAIFANPGTDTIDVTSERKIAKFINAITKSGKTIFSILKSNRKNEFYSEITKLNKNDILDITALIQMQIEKIDRELSVKPPRIPKEQITQCLKDRNHYLQSLQVLFVMPVFPWQRNNFLEKVTHEITDQNALFSVLKKDSSGYLTNSLLKSSKFLHNILGKQISEENLQEINKIAEEKIATATTPEAKAIFTENMALLAQVNSGFATRLKSGLKTGLVTGIAATILATTLGGLLAGLLAGTVAALLGTSIGVTTKSKPQKQSTSSSTTNLMLSKLADEKNTAYSSHATSEVAARAPSTLQSAEKLYKSSLPQMLQQSLLHSTLMQQQHSQEISAKIVVKDIEHTPPLIKGAFQSTVQVSHEVHPKYNELYVLTGDKRKISQAINLVAKRHGFTIAIINDGTKNIYSLLENNSPITDKNIINTFVAQVCLYLQNNAACKIQFDLNKITELRNVYHEFEQSNKENFAEKLLPLQHA